MGFMIQAMVKGPYKNSPPLSVANGTPFCIQLHQTFEVVALIIQDIHLQKYRTMACSVSMKFICLLPIIKIFCPANSNRHNIAQQGNNNFFLLPLIFFSFYRRIYTPLLHLVNPTMFAMLRLRQTPITRR
jgi:hypothetical protein